VGRWTEPDEESVDDAAFGSWLFAQASPAPNTATDAGMRVRAATRRAAFVGSVIGVVSVLRILLVAQFFVAGTLPERLAVDGSLSEVALGRPVWSGTRSGRWSP
jgi:hypothetical protein